MLRLPSSLLGPGLVALGLVLFAVVARTGTVPRPGPRLASASEALSPPPPLPDSATTPASVTIASVPAETTVVLRVEPLPVPPPVPPEPAAPPPYALVVPVAGVTPESLVDTFADFREDSTRVHRALDILAPTGTPVVAAAAGRIVRLHTSARGGLTVYQRGPDGRYLFYYAHLDRYADGLRAGQAVAPSDTLGTVGATGNADVAVPHLHFAIWRQRRGGTGWGDAPVNPFEALRR